LIHRDIKPQNIFINAGGHYKLGDFGISRKLEKTSSGLSKKGTYPYMAPEVYMGKEYNSNVDIYSLGMLMYRLLNGNRLPFLPLAPNPIRHDDTERALIRRMSGEEIPAPAFASKELSEIILKMCAYKKENRYKTASEVKYDLLQSLDPSQAVIPIMASISTSSFTANIADLESNDSYNKTQSIHIPQIEKTVSIFDSRAKEPETSITLPEIQPPAPPETPPTLPEPPQNTQTSTKKRTGLKILGILMASIIGVFILVFIINTRASDETQLSSSLLIGEWIRYFDESWHGMTSTSDFELSAITHKSFYADGTGVASFRIISKIITSSAWFTRGIAEEVFFEWFVEDNLLTIRSTNPSITGTTDYQITWASGFDYLVITYRDANREPIFGRTFRRRATTRMG